MDNQHPSRIFELNPLKGLGVIEIPRKFSCPPYPRGGEGIGGKKYFFVISGPKGNFVKSLKSFIPKKQTYTQMDRNTENILLL